MRFRIQTLLAVGALAIGAQHAEAISISYNGIFTLSDSGDPGSIRDTITFPTGTINFSDPFLDPIMVGGTLSIATLTLDESTLTPTSVGFSPTVYAGGFKANGYFVGDLTAISLEIVGSAGEINPFLSVNVTGIVPDAGYVAGTSAVADAFLAAALASANVTLQINLSQGSSLYSVIANSGGSSAPIINTYSGSASPAAVPDGGASILLLGLGLGCLGISGLGRRAA